MSNKKGGMPAKIKEEFYKRVFEAIDNKLWVDKEWGEGEGNSHFRKGDWIGDLAARHIRDEIQRSQFLYIEAVVKEKLNSMPEIREKIIKEFIESNMFEKYTDRIISIMIDRMCMIALDDISGFPQNTRKDEW